MKEGKGQGAEWQEKQINEGKKRTKMKVRENEDDNEKQN